MASICIIVTTAILLWRSQMNWACKTSAGTAVTELLSISHLLIVYKLGTAELALS